MKITDEGERKKIKTKRNKRVEQAIVKMRGQNDFVVRLRFCSINM